MSADFAPDEPRHLLRWLLRRPALGFALFTAGAFLLFWLYLEAKVPDKLVVYCAHDSIYSEKILRDFEKRTGIPLAIRFDTEATKSLGLVELLIHEKDAPRCDVFWNNELLGTLDLQERGLLAPYQGSGFTRIPNEFKDLAGHWAGFAARLRVYIYHTQKLPELARGSAEEQAAAVAAVLSNEAARAAIAKPLYGTTLTHYCVLWQAWGAARLQSWHEDRQRRGMIVRGNAAVKDAVAAGISHLGLTDTDDFFDAKDAGKPVGMLPFRMENGATICIPNTVALIRGSGRHAKAQQLVDFLLSAETELALARSRSRQIPLGPIEEAQLPAEVRELKTWAAEGTPLTSLGAARRECLAWLKSIYVQ